MFACNLCVGSKASSHCHLHETHKMNAFGRVLEHDLLVKKFHLFISDMQNSFRSDEHESELYIKYYDSLLDNGYLNTFPSVTLSTRIDVHC
jgi:hypothetical protein